VRPEDSVPAAAPRTRRELREAERQAQLAAASAGSAAGSGPASSGPVVTTAPVTSRRAARLSAGQLTSASRTAPTAQPSPTRPAQPTAPGTVSTAPSGRMPTWTSGTDIRPGGDPRPVTSGRRSAATAQPATGLEWPLAPAGQPAAARPEPRGTARDHAITPTAVTSSLSPRAAMPTERRPHAPGQPDTPAAGQRVAPGDSAPYAATNLAHAQGEAGALSGVVAPLADAATTAIPRTAAPPTTATVPAPSTPSAPAPSVDASPVLTSAPVPRTVPHAPNAAPQNLAAGPSPASVVDADAPRTGAPRSASRRPSSGRDGSSRPESGRRRRPARAATRLGVLAALAGVTVVIPVSQGAIAGTEVLSGAPLDKATLPSTVSALAAAPVSILPPASLVPGEGAIAARAAADAASRSESRSLLPGCDPRERSAGSNGLLPAKDLCTLWDGHTRLRADAAASLAEFNAAYVARFGADMCLASGYRTLAEQRSVKATRGSLAAAPGKSNHGWGLAVDFCSQLTSGERWVWLNANAKAFGWENPAWALPGGSGPHERWHWEYTKGVKADGEYYGS